MTAAPARVPLDLRARRRALRRLHRGPPGRRSARALRLSERARGRRPSRVCSARSRSCARSAAGARPAAGARRRAARPGRRAHRNGGDRRRRRGGCGAERGGAAAVAAPNPTGVLISEATHSLVEGYFDVEPRGLATLRGVLAPDGGLHRHGANGRARAWTPPRRCPRSPAREPELEAVVGAWRAVVAGQPSPALLVSGGGRDRQVAPGASRARRAVGADALVCPCSGYHQTTSLHAFRGVLERVCDITEQDSVSERLAKLRSAAGGETGDLPLLATALSIPVAATAAAGGRRSEQAAADGAARRGRPRPVACRERPVDAVVEDLHWADESTLDLIGVLLSTPPTGAAARARRPRALPAAVARRRPAAHRARTALTRGARDDGRPAARVRAARARAHPRADRAQRRHPAVSGGARSQPDARDPRGLYSSIRELDPRIPAALAGPAARPPGLAGRRPRAGADRRHDRPRRRPRAAPARRRAATTRRSHPRLANLMAAGLVDRSGERMIRFRHELIRVVAYETQRRTAARERHSRDRRPAATRSALPASRDAGEAAFHLERAGRYEEAVGAYIAAAQAASGARRAQGGDHRPHARARAGRAAAGGPPRLTTELTVRQLRSFSAVMAGGYSARRSRSRTTRAASTLCEELGSAPGARAQPAPGLDVLPSPSGDLAEADRVSDAIEEVLAPSGLSFRGARRLQGRELLLPGPLRRGARADGGVPAPSVGHSAGAAAERVADAERPVRRGLRAPACRRSWVLGDTRRRCAVARAGAGARATSSPSRSGPSAAATSTASSRCSTGWTATTTRHRCTSARCSRSASATGLRSGRSPARSRT